MAKHGSFGREARGLCRKRAGTFGVLFLCFYQDTRLTGGFYNYRKKEFLVPQKKNVGNGELF